MKTSFVVGTGFIALALLALSPAGAVAQTPDPAAEPVVKLPAFEVAENPIARVAAADNFASAATTVGEAQLRDLAALDFAGLTQWVNRDVPFYGEHGLGTSPILWEDWLPLACGF